MKNSILIIKSLFVSLWVALSAALMVWALWAAGVLASLQATFLLGSNGSDAHAIATPQPWVVTVLILSAGLVAGFAVERAGARRALPLLGVVMLLLCGLSIAASKFFQLDIVFAPVALSALAARLVFRSSACAR